MKSNTKKSVKLENNYSWFDSENARLIILCATLGVFGVHKFAQHKTFQGIVYVLLDLTVVGIILTVILSWLDLIFLTAKSDNRPGNMILGAMFILLESFVFISGSSTVVIKNVNPLLKSADDSVVSVENQTEPVTETEVSNNMDMVSVGDDVVAPEISVVKNDVSESQVVVDTEFVKPVEEKVVEPVGEKVAEPVKEKVVESVKEEEPVVIKKAPVVRQKPKKINETETSSNNVQQSDEFDEFEQFSLYNMVTGE